MGEVRGECRPLEFRRSLQTSGTGTVNVVDGGMRKRLKKSWPVGQHQLVSW